MSPALTPRSQASPGYDGKGKNFAQRRAARAGLNLATMVEPMFLAVDKDQSGACIARASHVHRMRIACASHMHRMRTGLNCGCRPTTVVR